jgi:outer membrane protein assembly factor BamB
VSKFAAFAAVLGIGGPPEPTPFEAAGAFTDAPAIHWVRPLPGPTFPAAIHTELGQPLLHGPFVYVGSAASDALYVLDRRDGSLSHQYAAAGPVQSAPVIVDEQVFFSDTAGYTWCYPIGGDKPAWKHYGGSPILDSPTIDGESVYVAGVGDVIYALVRDTGVLLWRHEQALDPVREAPLQLYGTPSPTLADDMVLFGAHDGTLVALSQDNGNRLWQRKVGEGRYPDLLGQPVIREGDAIVAGFSEPLMSLDLETRNIRWRVDAGGVQAAIVDGRRVYHGGTDGKLRAVDAVTGNVEWTWESKRGGTLGQPVRTPAGLLVASSAGTLSLIDPETGKRRWKLEPGHRLAGVTAGIAVDGRQVVITTNAGNLMSLIVPVDERDISSGILDGRLQK